MKDMNEQKNICMWGNVQLLLENVLKKLPLILSESTWRDRNAIKPEFLAYKCTINNKLTK